MGASRTGATVYMEPASLLDLNNAVMRLQSAEEEAELAVLGRLSSLLAEESPRVKQVLLDRHPQSPPPLCPCNFPTSGSEVPCTICCQRRQ